MTQKKFDLTQKLRGFGLPSVVQFILLGMGLALAVALYISLSGFVACWQLTSLAGIALPSCSGGAAPVATAKPGDTPAPQAATPTISAPDMPLPPAWDGASRVTLLVVGLRGGDNNENCPFCTDTMILLTIDPVSKTAGMLSIPRDMWVNIPGFGYGRMNSAYTDGELYKLPGGGPALAELTVENFLGIPIQYFAQIDFDAFVKMIDEIGGICLDVPVKVEVGVMDEHGTTVVDAGRQCLSGKVALGYARTRDLEQGVAGGDVDRSSNQQRVILAIREKVLANFLTLVPKAVPLYNQISSGIHTNLTLDDMLRLGMLAKDIPLDSINRGVIDYTMMQDGKTLINGQSADILRPYPDKIRELTDKVFGGGSLKPSGSGDLTELMKQEGARVLVVNGSGINGIGQKTYDYLKNLGVNVSGPGNMIDYPDKYRFPPLPDRTMIIIHAGKPYTARFLMALMKFDSANQFVVYFDPSAPADIVLAVGADWARAMP